MTDFLAGVLGLPDSAPRRIRQGAATLLLVVAVVAPQTYTRAVTVFVQHRVEAFTKVFLPTPAAVVDEDQPHRDARKSDGRRDSDSSQRGR